MVVEARETQLAEWNRLRELHEMARHQVLAVDKSLSDLLVSLEQMQ